MDNDDDVRIEAGEVLPSGLRRLGAGDDGIEVDAEEAGLLLDSDRGAEAGDVLEHLGQRARVLLESRGAPGRRSATSTNSS
jgi:hypothetical protein